MKALKTKGGGGSRFDASLAFFRQALGVQVVNDIDLVEGLCTMRYLAPPGEPASAIEMVRFFDRNACNVAYVVGDVEQACRQVLVSGAMISRPSRFGSMALICSPDGISAELIQNPLGHQWMARTHA